MVLFYVHNINSSFCAQHQLVVANTVLQQCEIHKGTWQHPRSKSWHMIDHCITRQRELKDIQTIRTLRGTDCGTDHILTRAKFKSQIETTRRKTAKAGSKNFNTLLLNYSSVRDILASAFSSCLVVMNNKSAEDQWTHLRDRTLETA
jgi:hypothetical protein